jgi:signal transduction histidine kinase/CheY-like chemotaxis protein
MPEILLTPLAVSYLGIMLPLAFAVFFLCRGERRNPDSGAAKPLRWSLIFLFGYATCGFLENSLFQAGNLVPLICGPWFLSISLWWLVGFIYEFPVLPESQRQEARWVRLLALALPLHETGIATWRLIALFGAAQVHWRPPNSHYPFVIAFAWLSLVLWRRSAGWWMSCLRRRPLPNASPQRAQVTLAVLCAGLILLVFVASRSSELIPDLLRETITGTGLLIATYVLITLGFSAFCAQNSLRLRLAGFTLITMLALLNAANWVVTGLYLEALAATSRDGGALRTDFVESLQTIRCTPNPLGGYDLVRVPARFEPVGEALSPGDGGFPRLLPLRVPFAFFRERHDAIRVDQNGWIAFGPRNPMWSDFRWRYGSVPLLAPAMMALQSAGPTNAGVFLAELPDRTAITWQNSPIQSQPQGPSPKFQAVLHTNGIIDLNYRALTPGIRISLTRTSPLRFVALLPGRNNPQPDLYPFAQGRLAESRSVGPEGAVHDVQLELRRQLHPISLRICWLTLAGVAGYALLFPLLIRRLMLAPLNRLREAIHLLETGGTAPEVTVDRPDEIGDLTGAFNRMSAAIRTSAEALRQHRDRLEDEVAIRTAALRDEIEERKRVAEQLALSKVAAEAASQAKSEFLASMSHEIRTPMNGIIGTANLLLETNLTRDQRELVEIGRSSSESLLTIVNDILDFSKIEAGQMHLEHIRLDLRELLDGVLDTFGAATSSRFLGLLWWADANVPRFIQGDPVRLRQVLVNLVNNAVKFTREGGVDLYLSLGTTPAGETRLRVAVRDTGIGMSEETQGRLFRAFSQADSSTTRRFGGTGLGLIICRQLVELMGGDISVTSAPDAGSTFVVTLPLTPADNLGEPLLPAVNFPAPRIVLHSENEWLHERLRPALAATLGSRAEGAPAPGDVVVLWDASLPWAKAASLGAPAGRRILLSLMAQRPTPTALASAGFSAVLTLPLKPAQLLSGLANLPPAPESTPPSSVANAGVRLLVVEDNPVNEKLVRAMLGRLGIAHDIARDGQEALRLTAAKSYETLLLDCQLPDLPGWEVCRQLRAPGHASRGAKVIAFTAGLTPPERELCSQAGVDEFLGKPVQLAELRAKLLPDSPAPVA